MLYGPWRFYVAVACLAVFGAVGCTTTTTPAALTPESAPAEASSEALARITKIATDTQGDTFRIIVQTTSEVQYTTFRLQKPLRLAVDIADATLAPGVKPVAFSEGIASGVDPIAFPDKQVVRMLVPLRQPASHLVSAVGNELRIALSADSSVGKDRVATQIDHQERDEPRATESQDPAANPVAASQRPSATPAREATTLIDGVEFRSLPGASVIELQLAGSLPQIRVKQQTHPLRLTMDVKNARLNPKQNNLMAVHDPAGVVAQVQALQSTHGDAETVHIVAYLKTKAPFEVRQLDDRVRVILTPSATGSVADGVTPATAPSMPMIAQATPVTAPLDASGAALPMVAQATPTTDTSGVPAPITAATIGDEGEKNYTGEKISLDFQNADINDILRLIAEVSGLNIIAGPDVKGTVQQFSF